MVAEPGRMGIPGKRQIVSKI